MYANWSLLGDPALNIQAGTKYLANRIKKFGGKVREGLARYGTGLAYADSILKCEECLKHEAAAPVGCKTSDCLQPLHGR